MSQNGISTLSTKQLKQNAKLSAAATKRATDGRPSTLDTTLLPSVYTDNDVTIQSHPSGLVEGRPWTTSQVYTGLIFTYGQATISFTLTSGVFSNVTCPYGAGGYPFGPGVDPVIIMPGNQLTGGTTPANDIYWEYTAVGGVITGFTYRSGTPP